MSDPLHIMPPRAVDAAIAAAAKPTVQMARIKVMIASTGRPAAIEFPADATDGELAELCGWILTVVMGSLRAERAKTASGRILVPRR